MTKSKTPEERSRIRAIVLTKEFYKSLPNVQDGLPPLSMTATSTSPGTEKFSQGDTNFWVQSTVKGSQGSMMCCFRILRETIWNGISFLKHLQPRRADPSTPCKTVGIDLGLLGFVLELDSLRLPPCTMLSRGTSKVSTLKIWSLLGLPCTLMEWISWGSMN